MKNLSRADKERRLILLREKRIRICRLSFWEYCKTESPDFYREDRWHLKLNCFTLQALYERKLTKAHFRKLCEEIAPTWYAESIDWDRLIDGHIYTKLMQNLPPRHGKSRTLVNFCKWVLGKSKKSRIITCSYNDDLATTFSRYTRDGITEKKNLPTQIVYSDIFPESKIKQGNAGYQEWALEGEFFNYKGAGVGGSITGKGCNISIVDDPVKDAETAFNENALDKIWQWYTGTFLSRLEDGNGGGIEIVNMTRWAKGDVCGRLLNGPEKNEWLILSMEACNTSGEMLCPSLLSKGKYESLKKNMDEVIFGANYHQRPVDVQGKLYKNIKTYTTLPADSNGASLTESVLSYTDTADEGSDFLCTVVAHIYQGCGYVTDVYYTKEGMDVTEPGTASFLYKNNVNLALIESNNGGKNFARNVRNILWTVLQTKAVVVKWFSQSKNKMARILTNSNFVMENIYFPINWKDRWPEFYAAITSFQREGKNKHDDAPDALTGLAEMIQGINLKIQQGQEKQKERQNRKHRF